jgi:hypothetical protein
MHAAMLSMEYLLRVARSQPPISGGGEYARIVPGPTYQEERTSALTRLIRDYTTTHTQMLTELKNGVVEYVITVSTCGGDGDEYVGMGSEMVKSVSELKALYTGITGIPKWSQVWYRVVEPPPSGDECGTTQSALKNSNTLNAGETVTCIIDTPLFTRAGDGTEITEGGRVFTQTGNDESLCLTNVILTDSTETASVKFDVLHECTEYEEVSLHIGVVPYRGEDDGENLNADYTKENNAIFMSLSESNTNVLDWVTVRDTVKITVIDETVYFYHNDDLVSSSTRQIPDSVAFPLVFAVQIDNSSIGVSMKILDDDADDDDADDDDADDDDADDEGGG